MTDLAIETTGLTKRFGRLVAVDGIDLEVPVGSVYGFLGRNGAGKTTTIQMLMGMLQPTAGEMRVLGFNPLREDVPMKRVVSYVPERVQMYDWMWVREIVWFGATIHPRWDDDAAAQLIERFDLPPQQKVGQLSRGMQGKLALALAMASHPKLLILDDPTSGLDAVVRREFIESIVGVLQETGATVFFSSHIIDDVERVADWIGIIHEGKLLVQEPLESLKSRVRRVVATFEGEAPAPGERLEGVLSAERSGRQLVLITDCWGDELRRAIDALGPTSVETEDCSLEDIFVAYVRKVPEAAGMG
ncbi:MAG: ABC transporter ATP-binding protein [Armatimonadota bacterium]|nr:ABC transporter ATP-binding protein [Armatimonadota bacterium]